MRLMFAAAALKIAAGLGVSPWAASADANLPLPGWYYVLLLLIFGVGGGMLFLGGGRDARARWLGLVFLSFGTLFTDRLLGAAIPLLPGPARVPLLLIARTHLIAFQPLLSWQFAWHFPRVQSALVPPWLAHAMVRVSAVAGATLLVGNLVAH